MAAQVEQPRRQEAADDQYQRAGDAGRHRPESEDDGEGNPADHHGDQAGLVQRPEPGAQFLQRVGAADVGPGQLGQLADDHIDGRSEQEAGDHRLGQELRHPAHLEDGHEQEEQAGSQGEGGHE